MSSPAPSASGIPVRRASSLNSRTRSNSVMSTASSTSSSTHRLVSMPVTPVSTPPAMPSWNNNSRLSEPQPPSQALARSKSYAANLKRTKSGNVVSASSPNLRKENDDASVSPRSLAASVVELEGLLDIALATHERSLSNGPNRLRQIAQGKDKDANHEPKFSALKSEIADLKSQNETLELEKELADADQIALKSEILSLTTALASLRSENESLNALYWKAREDLANKESEPIREAKLISLENEVASLKLALSSLTTENAQFLVVKEELAESVARAVLLESSIKTLHAENDKLRSSLAQVYSENEHASIELALSAEEPNGISDWKARISALESEKEDLHKRLQQTLANENELREAKSEISVLRTTIASLQSDKDALQSQLPNQEMLSALIEETERLRTELKQLQQENATFRQSDDKNLAAAEEEDKAEELGEGEESEEDASSSSSEGEEEKMQLGSTNSKSGWWGGFFG
ncbi:hypothetical protein HDU82_001408 [Entophlyctis luteolus]|nr:hypothetical protein HDU82_001408 [Entophlyctis luteolus]